MPTTWPTCPRCQGRRVRPARRGRTWAVMLGAIFALGLAGFLWPVAWVLAVVLGAVTAWRLRGGLECQDCAWRGTAP